MLTTNITFVCDIDKNTISIPYEDAIEMNIVRNLIADLGDMIEPIHLDNEFATAENLSILARYIPIKKAMVDSPPAKDKHALFDWEREFFAGMSYVNIIQGIYLGNYVDYEDYMTSCAKKFADTIRGKSCEEIRAMYEFADDFTPEERARNAIEIDALKSEIPC